MASKDQEWVYYHAGGVRGARPVLRGTDAKETFESIPVIDVSGIFSPDLEDRKKVATQIGKACREVGFFYAQNHSVPSDLIEETFEAIKKFFALPREDKMEVHLHKNAALRGYEPLFETNLEGAGRGDMKEAFLIGQDASEPEQSAPLLPPPSTTALNSWPSAYPEFRPAVYRYYAQAMALARKLIRTFALALDLPETYFDAMTSFPMIHFRMLHYPPQEAVDARNIGIGAHTDYTFFTLVQQEHISGLQVLNANGIWVDAKPIPGTYVVNVGDFFARVTNNRFTSTVHRVLNLTGEERYSMPFFFAPNPEAVVEVVPSCRGEGEEEKKGIVAGEYFMERLRAARWRHPSNQGKPPPKVLDVATGEVVLQA
ncbi:Clavaminate synthase-like protein [Bimuria novae-zelandiae CBS 107.79]|uniref:Clavaminate synthase-like protein n=1 Tax=Bimuria novae-zelandiae CBS 107.79 TaxID=1447943 RepID=A0A6A5UHU1_9PLEO|nr:Clavaminate synthase-like protein [Bimuria novae-zelandiae CBS 107.79]